MDGRQSTRGFDWRAKRFSGARSTAQTDASSSIYFTGEPSQFTFYREGTPPPSLHEKTPSGTWTGTWASSTGPVLPNDGTIASSGEEDGAGRICGLKKRVFWIALLAVVLLVGVAVGVGAGIGASKKSSSAAADSTASSSISPVPAATATSTSASQLSSASATPSSTYASATATPTTFVTDCPATNNTYYTATDSDKRFLRLCGVDYSGTSGAVDITNLLTSNMTECMDACGNATDCTACGWGYIDGDLGDKHRCWLKKDLGKSHDATGWCFAILV